MSDLRPGSFAWTAEQTAAVTATGDVLLAASAGTGKTTTVVGKILWHLGLETGIERESGERLRPCPHPCRLDQVAAITFTEKAAYDLKRKLRERIRAADETGDLRWELDRSAVGTIHGFCGDLLREHALRLGIDPTFRVLDERETRIQQDELIHDVLMRVLEARDTDAALIVKRFGLYDRGFQKGGIAQVRTVLRDLRWHARRYDGWIRRGDSADRSPELDSGRLGELAVAAGIQPKNAGMDPESDGGLAVAAALYRLAHRSLARWLAWLERENVRDFDSLILDARRLLTRASTRPALDAIRRRYRLLIIDEFQDTDAAQRDIAFAIAGRLPDDAVPPGERPQLFLVGDPKQSIYGFRGADIAVWNEVRQALCTDGEPMHLSRNFRSEPQVVDLVNRICSPVMEERAAALAAESPASAVRYHELHAARAASDAGGTEWLATGGTTKADRVELEARLIASHVQRMLRSALVRDPGDGTLRRCKAHDIAILARTRDALIGVEGGLRQYGIPYYNTATAGLAGRQEIMDLVTALRLIENPRDDLRAFAYLRSPFVGLRDEVLARIRLDPALPRASLLEQAESFLTRVQQGHLQPFPAPESERIHEVELEALGRGLAAVDEAIRLVNRADHAELLESILERTGYRLHLLLRPSAAESLANVERLQALLAEYRHLTLGGFLRLWDRWGEEDLGVPQAPLFSADDNAVTLSTIHTAKGLEWPIVLLARTTEGPGDGRKLTNTFRSDPAWGPVFLLRGGDRDERARRVFERVLLEEHAEEARLLYVALTRARDRLVISGPTGGAGGFAAWLAPALDGAIEAHAADARRETLPPGSRDSGRLARSAGDTASRPDPVTGTGRQIDAFGFDHEAEDANGQYSLFAVSGRPPDPEGDGSDAAADPLPETGDLPVVIHRTAEPIQAVLAEAPLSLAWLEEVGPCDLPAVARSISPPALRSTTSATELRLRERHSAEWVLRYRHGVIPVEQFAPPPDRGDQLPATVRGGLIHGVLERIEEEEELARILDEAIAGIETPEAEVLLEPGAAYRQALEAEIRAVVRSSEWAWYVEGRHWRELPFLHLVGEKEWRIGAFDLFRPESGVEERDAVPWIIDFKTHEIGPDDVETVADGYRVQAGVYREAVAAIRAEGGQAGADAGCVRVALHFTHPNVAVEM